MEMEAIEEYVTYAEQILDENPQMDEANTKAKLIRDLLEVLGWDFATDVELEYPVPMANRTHKVDYALLLEETPVVFVEAKGCDSTLSDGHREQLKSYMKNQDIDWGLLTNGRANEIYQRHIEDTEVLVKRLGTIEVNKMIQSSNLLSALSREFIKNGEAERIAQRIIEIERTKTKLRENKENISEAVARTIADRVGDLISKQAESEAKTLVDNLVAELEDDADPAKDFWTNVEQETGITKRNGEIILQESKSASGQLQEFVDFLFERNYLNKSNIPIPLGRKRYLVNTEPVDQQGDEMKRPKRVGDGFYVEGNQKADRIKRRILELGERFS